MHLVNYQHSTYIISEKIRQVIMLVVLGDTEGATLFCGKSSCWRCVLPFLSSEETEVDRMVRLQYWVAFVGSG